MGKNVSKEELKEIKPVLLSLNTAIKNSALYVPGHPSFSAPIEQLKTHLDKWFFSNDKLDLGISVNTLFLNGKEIIDETSLCFELADYMHARGILSFSVRKGVELNELISFFTFIKKDSRAIKEISNVEEIIPKSRNLGIVTIDYRDLLGSAKDNVTDEEGDVWNSLINIARKTETENLPESKLDFLSDFLKNPSKAATSLNKIYKDALTKLNENTVLSDVHETVTKIYSYFSGDSGSDAKKIKGEILQVIARLHPALVAKIFERVSINSREFNLAEEITKEFSDSFIADFMESLITGEEVFNEDLLKVFDKLAPEGSCGSVASIIADKLFDKGLLEGESLTQLQSSIKDIFEKNPKNDFMAEMYKITVSACVNKKIDRLNYVAKLSPLITRYVKSVKEEKLKKEELDLLLNLMWFENDPVEFEKLGQKLREVFFAALNGENIRGIKEIIEFFTEKIRPEQLLDKRIKTEKENVFKEIRNTDVIKKIVSFIPDAKDNDLEDIVFILAKTKDVSGALLIDAFIAQRNKTNKLKFSPVFSRLKEIVVEEAVKRAKTAQVSFRKELFDILKEYAPEKTREIARKLIMDKNIQTRMEALEAFVPETEEERKAVFGIIRKERNEELRDRAISILLKTRNGNTITKLFQYAEKRFVDREILAKVVELCGYMAVEEGAEYLKKIFNKKSFFPSRKIDDLRIAAVSSLRRIDAEKAKALIKTGLNDKSKRVKEMCEAIEGLIGYKNNGY